MNKKQAIKTLIEGNVEYATKMPNKVFDNMLSKQTPQVTLVYCSDSRVPSHMFTVDTLNYIFGIENIGNQIATAEGSVTYGVEHLHTPVLMILGHTGCGAVKASLGDFSGEKMAIQKELQSLSYNFSGNFDDEADHLVMETKYAQLNVDAQVEYAVKQFGKLVDSGKLVVVGAMFDFHDVYSKNRGEIFITNINGETDTGKIKAMESLSGLDEKLRDVKVRRI